jgi:lactoylglutathione lyase
MNRLLRIRMVGVVWLRRGKTSPRNDYIALLSRSAPALNRNLHKNKHIYSKCIYYNGDTKSWMLMNTTPTKLDFVSLQVQNLEASQAFYTNTLGFEVTQSPNPDAIVFQDTAGVIFAIRKPLTDLSTVLRLGIGISLWFAVADAEAAYRRAIQTEARIIQNPANDPLGRMFVLLDPDSYSMTVHQS